MILNYEMLAIATSQVKGKNIFVLIKVFVVPMLDAGPQDNVSRDMHIAQECQWPSKLGKNPYKHSTFLQRSSNSNLLSIFSAV